MSTYRRYQEARDTAWRALLQGGFTRLPVEPEGLARRIGVEALPFPGEDEPRLRHLIRLTGGGFCVSLRLRGRWHIFLRQDRMDESQRRFAVAHELGHLLLSHPTRRLAPGVRAFESRENQGDLIEDPESLDDYAADIFAIRLLAPACVLHELHLDQSGPIMRLCGLPPRAAALRAERMQLLNQRDVFYNHPLERQVRDQFLPFLGSRKAEAHRPAVFPAPPARHPLMTPLRPAVPAASPESATAASAPDGVASHAPNGKPEAATLRPTDIPSPPKRPPQSIPDPALAVDTLDTFAPDAASPVEGAPASADSPHTRPFPLPTALALAIVFGVLLFFLLRA